MSEPSVSAIPASVRTRLADQLDEVVRQLQVAQSVLRADLPTLPLATLSTGLIGALITTREVSDAVGMAEGQAYIAQLGVRTDATGQQWVAVS